MGFSISGDGYLPVRREAQCVPKFRNCLTEANAGVGTLATMQSNQLWCGLAVQNDFTIVGLSKCRQNRAFTGIVLDDILASGDARVRRGMSEIDI